MTGSGTALDPYIIANMADLQSVESYAVGGVVTAYFELGADIDGTGVPFTPICDGSATIFAGCFDGKGFKISNLSVSVAGLAGLFGAVLGVVETAVLNDIELVDATIESTAEFAGGLAGSVLGNVTVANCSVSGAVTGSDSVGGIGGMFGYVSSGNTISGCTSLCDVVAGENSYAGGLIGNCESDVAESLSYGNVSAGPGSYIGGFVGYVSGATISKCGSSGDVSQIGSGADANMGGFAGYEAPANFYDCFSNGNVDVGVGSGLVGGFTSVNQGETARCYSSGTVSAGGGGFVYESWSGIGVIDACMWDTDNGGLLGLVVGDGTGMVGKSTAQLYSEATLIAAGWDTTTVWYCSGVAYPTLGGWPTASQMVRTDPVSEVLVE